MIANNPIKILIVFIVSMLVIFGGIVYMLRFKNECIELKNDYVVFPSTLSESIDVPAVTQEVSETNEEVTKTESNSSETFYSMIGK